MPLPHAAPLNTRKRATTSRDLYVIAGSSQSLPKRSCLLDFVLVDSTLWICLGNIALKVSSVTDRLFDGLSLVGLCVQLNAP